LGQPKENRFRMLTYASGGDVMFFLGKWLANLWYLLSWAWFTRVWTYANLTAMILGALVLTLAQLTINPYWPCLRCP